MTDAYERRCHLLLRAYPPRYRQARQDELLGTLLDAAEPGRDAPSLRDSWDVVRAGLLFRLRDRPPVHWWLAYRVFGARLPYRHRWWARDDMLGRGYYLRYRAGSMAMVILPMLIINVSFAVLYDLSFGLRNLLLIFGGVAIGTAFGLLPWRFHKRRALKMRNKGLAKHEFHPDGTPFQAPSWQATAQPQPNRERP